MGTVEEQVIDRSVFYESQVFAYLCEAETKKQVEACVSTWLGNDHLM